MGDQNGYFANSIKGDGTAGRILKALHLVIEDGTNANTIKATTSSMFAGDVIGATDNISKGATTGNFTLSADGRNLTIEAAGLTGNIVGIISCNCVFNNSALYALPYPVIVSNDIRLDFYAADGSTQDLTTIAAGKQIDILVGYVTSA